MISCALEIFLLTYLLTYTGQANESRQATEDLLNEHEELMTSLATTMNSSSSALEGALEQQRIMDGLLAAVNQSRMTADDAISNAEQTLRDAEQTLNTLRGEFA